MCFSNFKKYKLIYRNLDFTIELYTSVIVEHIIFFQRLTGDDAEYEMFKTREEAERWVEEWQFFVVRFKDGKLNAQTITDHTHALMPCTTRAWGRTQRQSQM